MAYTSLILHTVGPTMSLCSRSKETAISLGKMQDLITETLDGYVLVVLGDGTIVYVSDNIHKYLGLFQVNYGVEYLHIVYPLFSSPVNIVRAY